MCIIWTIQFPASCYFVEFVFLKKYNNSIRKIVVLWRYEMMQGQHFLKATLRYYFIVKVQLASIVSWTACLHNWWHMKHQRKSTKSPNKAVRIKIFLPPEIIIFFYFSPEQTGGGGGGQQSWPALQDHLGPQGGGESQACPLVLQPVLHSLLHVIITRAG